MSNQARQMSCMVANGAIRTPKPYRWIDRVVDQPYTEYQSHTVVIPGVVNPFAACQILEAAGYTIVSVDGPAITYAEVL